MSRDEFLAPAVEALKALIQDAGTGDLDDVYLKSVNIAYSMIASHCKREFYDAGDDIVRHFTDIEDRVYIPNFPLSDVEKVEAISFDDPEELVEDEDYRFETGDKDPRNCIVFASNHDEVRITYRAGYETIDLNPILLDAVVTQALEIYKKKDFVGIVNTDSTSVSNPELAVLKLSPAVRLMVRTLVDYAD